MIPLSQRARDALPGRRLLVLVVAATALSAVMWWGVPDPSGVLRAVDWVRSAGAAGFVALAAVYLLATLLMVPGSWLQGATGFVYGPTWGFALALTMSTLFGSLSFLLARGWLRGWIEGRVRGDPRFEALDEAVGDGGTYLVALVRMPPISPYNLVNYLLGLTRVSPRDYLLGSAIGSTPAILFYAFLGSSVDSVAQLLDGSAAADAGPVYWAGLATTIVATILVTRFARQALRRAIEAQRQPEPAA